MKTRPRHNWTTFLKLFTEENQGRKTRTAVFEGTPEAMSDYWLEEGLPLVGIDVDPDGTDGPDIEIMLQNQPNCTPLNMTHTVKGARFVKIILSASGDADGLEVDNGRGETTILHFQN